jgi:predicted enzyme related to lactoylglutathione lyase
MGDGLLRKVDAVTFHVPDLDSGIAFYVRRLEHRLKWRNDEIGQVGLALPDGDSEIVLTTEHDYEPNWLVESADDALTRIEEAGGRTLTPPFDIPVAASLLRLTRSATCWSSSTSRRAVTRRTRTATSRPCDPIGSGARLTPSHRAFRRTVRCA